MAGMHQTKQLTTFQVYKDFEKNLIRESQHRHDFEVKETTTTLAMTPKELKRTPASPE
jgi:DNA-binding NtrC family response regulator